MSQIYRLLLLFACAIKFLEGRELNLAEITRNVVISDCCTFGTQFGFDTFISCTNINSFNYSKISGKYHHDCRDRMVKCCNTKRLELCNEGSNGARNDQNCNHRTGMWKLCCNACKEGLKNAENGENCNKKFMEGGTFPTSAFMKCCNEESSNFLSSDEENSANEVDYESSQENSNDYYDSQEPLEAPAELRSNYKFDKFTIEEISKLFHALNRDQKIFIHQNRNGSLELKVSCKSNHGCEFDCLMKDGKETCTCPEDYVLASDDKSCCRSIYEEGRGGREHTIKPPMKKCPQGQFLNDLEYCEYLNECKINNNACGKDLECVNTIESFYCIPKTICKEGFRFNNEKKKCVDINECSENTHDCRCDEICVNNEGGYKCKAFCQVDTPYCETVTKLVPEDYSPEPTTTKKYVWFPATTSRPQTTTKSSRLCEFSTSASEEFCPPSHECNSDSDCKTNFICVSNDDIRSCQEKTCDLGFELINGKCIDIDECENDPQICPPTFKCNNKKGSHECILKTCEAGYSLDINGICHDINECLLKIDECQNSQCHNTEGSYECHCNEGFVKDYFDDFKCEDFDECEEKNRCDQNCINTHGSFYCSCRPGFILNSDKRSCEDEDECLSNPCPKTANCLNLIGSYECERKTCDFGLILNDEGECEDLDECLQLNVCLNGDCRNTYGSYTCECHEGFENDPDDDKICNDVNECESLNDCSHNCVNTLGSYVCKCRDGYELESDGHSCRDINECYNFPCKRSEECENLLGTFKCNPKKCQPGFEFDSFYDCVDIDECKIFNSTCLHGTCINTIGSYRCKCDEGLKLIDDQTCGDIDECEENTNLCMHDCRNIFKSYYCTCRRGFKLNSDGRTCADIDECKEEIHTCRSDQKCVNRAGGFNCVNKCEKKRKCKPFDIVHTTTTTQNPCWMQCQTDSCQTDSDCQRGTKCLGKLRKRCRRLKCRRGLRINQELNRCQDINECTEGLHNCVEGEICENIKGSFRCIEKFYESRAAPPCRFMPQDKVTTTTTASPCLVTKTTASTRRPTVICPPGYTRSKRGTNCVEVNPCDLNPCEKDENCSTQNGTANCSKIICSTGLELKDGICVDINECNLHPCIGECVNTLGSYKCLCTKGFKKNGNFCEDINECSADPKICGHLGQHSECLNTVGGYECFNRTCDEGYVMKSHLRTKNCELIKKCFSFDSNCEMKPHITNEVFITTLSNITEEREIFSSTLNLNVEAKIEKFTAEPEEGVEKGDQSDFSVTSRAQTFILKLLKPLFGPQKIKIELLVSVYEKSGNVYYQKLQKILIYVSKFTSSSYDNSLEVDEKKKYF